MYEETLCTEPHSFIFADVLNSFGRVVDTRSYSRLSDFIVLKLLHIRQHIFHDVELHLRILHISDSRFRGRWDRSFLFIAHCSFCLSCSCHSSCSWLRTFDPNVTSCFCSMGVWINVWLRVLLFSSAGFARLIVLISCNDINKSCFFDFKKIRFINLVFV